MRAFIAIELTAEVSSALSTLQKRLAGELDRAALAHTVRWVNAAGIHLTLRFLGDTSNGAHNRLTRRLRTVVAASERFTLAVSGIGCFPNFRRPSVVWAGVGGDLDALRALQGPIEDAARAEGFAAETRSFSPHLTLGRFRREAASADLARAGETVQHLTQDPAVANLYAILTVCEVVFFQSDLRPSGAVYTALDRLEIGGS